MSERLALMTKGFNAWCKSEGIAPFGWFRMVMEEILQYQLVEDLSIIPTTYMVTFTINIPPMLAYYTIHGYIDPNIVIYYIYMYIPIGSMYAIYIYMVTFTITPNVSIYTIHGSCGIY